MSQTPASPVQAPRAVLGIDLAKADFAACLLSNNERHRRTFTNTPTGFTQLWAWLAEHSASQAVIALEATGPYGEPLAQAAFAAGHQVLMLNPRRVAQYAKSCGRRNKTDRADAEVIARFAQDQWPRQRAWWQPLPPAQAGLRALLRRQADLEAALHAEQRRLEVAQPEVLASARRSVRWLEAELRRLEATIQKHLRAHGALAHDVGRLRQIAGFGEKTARLLVAEIPRHFRNARAVAAWLGVVPRQVQSGTSVRQASRVGHEAPWLRAKLYFPAITAMRCDPRCQVFASRLRTQGKAPMSVVMAVLHKLIRTAFALLKNQSPYDPKHQVQFAPASR